MDDGTSPRTRGKLMPMIFMFPFFSEHPRARGENSGSPAGGVGSEGTSPRTRGKLHSLWGDQDIVGNIPAHAGKTPGFSTIPPAKKEHPRARGENENSWKVRLSFEGTSPRTRGKPSHPPWPGVHHRNIPAHAGKTLIDVRFLVPEGHFTFGFIFPHHGGVKFILS